MPVRKYRQDDGTLRIELLDDAGLTVEVVGRFLDHLAARGYSPNTLVAYAHDLQHFWRFLSARGLTWDGFRPPDAFDLLEHLQSIRTDHPRRRPPVAADQRALGAESRALAPATVNRILAAVSSFYEIAVLTGRYDRGNPIEKEPDPFSARTSDRHRPFLSGIARQRPLRRTVRVRTTHRLPRPLSEEQTAALFDALRSRRDIALVRLMLDGGLRPGEALALHLADVAYGRRRVTVRCRQDHPKGARQKSRFERVVNLHEPATLRAVSDYVTHERPDEEMTAGDRCPFLFRVGGRGQRRMEVLSYAALAKLFRRACQRAGLDEPWITLHSLRHTHATRMWEGGMRELALQKRLGHASPESTRVYTRVSDEAVVAEYRRALMAPTAEAPDTLPEGRP